MSNCDNSRIINNGKCTICGKDLDGNRLFLCETCQRLSVIISLNYNDLTELLDSDKEDLTDDVIKILNKTGDKIKELTNA